MANPIIKIKRGSGVPTSAGITAGEFAFNKTGNILYVGACGGYTGYDGVNSFGGIVPGATTLNIIPIGMQISNDPNMGSGGGLNDFVGYSDFTVPTTRAVRDWVNQTKMNQVLGATFRAGPGIGITSDQDAGSTQYDITISNTGVIKGFTGFNVIGNFHPSSDVVKAKSAIDGITFIGGGGIQLRGTNSAGTLEIQNYGVTSIGGFTGTINTFSPIHSLDGFSADIGILLRSAVSVDGVITSSIVDTPGVTGIQLSHATSGVATSTHAAYVGSPLVPQLLNLGINAYGHITSYSTAALNFGTGIPLGFAQAVQDAAYPGITNFWGPNNYGIDYVYDDANNRLRTINRGITSLGAVGSADRGLSGAVLLAVGAGSGGFAQLSVAQDKNTNTITYEYIGKQYKSFSLVKHTSAGYPSIGIYLGGVTGAGTGTNTAATAIANLNVVPGRGIGVSMGTMGSLDTMLIWNAGVNRISAYNSNAVLLGATGYSGNLEIRAGTNIDLTRNGEDNILTISSTAGGGGGAVSAIKASYGELQTDLQLEYGDSGVTGGIVFKGQNGLITRQEVAGDGTSTKNGDLYVGLTSRVKIPAAVIPGQDIANDPGYQILEIATIRENGGAPQPAPSIDYFGTPTEYSKLITDVVEGGFTGGFGAQGGINNSFINHYTGFAGPNTTPGKILILRSREGFLDIANDAFDPSATGKYGEIRLLAWPNSENMPAYINQIYDHLAATSSNYGDCPSGNCAEYPPSLPTCLVDNENYSYTKDNPDTSNEVSTAVFHADIVARDSIFVQKDIWLTGELIDATTGCLYGGGSPGGPVSPGGNLGLTGDLVVNGSIYVHGGTAFFNVADLSTESPLIRIGGLSASDSGYSQIMQSGIGGVTNRFGDRGLLLFSFNPTPYGAMGIGGTPTQAVSSPRVVTNFIGIDQDDGVLKYIIEATTNSNSNNYTTINSGRLGPAKFSEINNVGITSDANAVISLKAATSNGVINTTGIDLKGFAAITASPTSGNKANIILANTARVQLGVVDGVGITFNRSIEFDSGQSDTFANSLKIRYQGPGDTQAFRNISIRAPVSGGYTQLVDVGRSPQSDASGAYVGGSDNQGQQTIYNKTLADGTIIDCGTY